MQKISLIIILFVFALFPAKQIKNYENNNNFAADPLDSLRIQVVKNGWNNSELASYQFHILNSQISIKKEDEDIEKLPVSFERTFLYSLVLKRELKFQEMFDSLFSVLHSSPEYLEYYDELSFAASATNRSSLIESYFEKNNSLGAGFRSYLLGLLNLSDSKSKAALEYLLSALKSDSLNPHILYQLSFAYHDIGDYPKALYVLNKSMVHNTNDQYLKAQILLAMGSVYYLSGETDNAEKYYLESFRNASTLNDSRTKSRAMVDLGIINDIKGNSSEARTYFFDAQKIAADINDIEDQALAFSELGVSLSFTNNLIEAKHNYLKSYEMYKLLGNWGRLSLLSDNIAKIYMTMFDYHSALKYYNQGIRFAGDNKRARILNLIGLADVYTNLSNYSKAIDYYNEAKNLNSGINELSLKAEVNKGLGILNYNLDNYENALHYFNSFEETTQKSGYLYMEADACHKMGICLMQIDSLKKSGDLLLKAETLAQKTGDSYLAALCYTDFALLNIKMNNHAGAIESIKKAKTLAANGKFYYLDARIELIEGDISDNFANAKLHYDASLSISKKISNFDLQIESYSSLALLFDKNNLSDAARSYYNSAVNLVDDISRPLFKSNDIQISYISSKQDVYSSYAGFLLKQKDYVNAFSLIDKSRSRNLMQNLTNLKLQSLIKDEKSLDRLYEYNWMIHSAIYSKRQVDSISLQYNVFKKDLVSADNQLSEFLDNKSTLSISGIQDKLNTGENILSIYSTDDNTYLFLINKKGFQTFKTGIPKNGVIKLLSSVSPYYSREGSSQISFYNQDLFSFNSSGSFELYNKLLKEALSKIPKQEKIIVVPSVELVVLPFDFLVAGFDKESSSYSYADKHFLIYDYDFSYSTSASAFITEKGNHLSNSNKSLVVGDPAIDTHLNGFSERRGLLNDNQGIQRSFALLPLKYSKEEVSEIGNILGADKILTNKDATESNFKRDAEFRSIIHLATHSFLFNKQPVIFFSNIADKDNDGILEASEIVQLRLNCDLVVLSSCNSGLGRLDESEGIIGMSKAFFEAGVKSIIVSLWEVNDKYTSRLMTLFYKKLSSGLDKSEALRQAKIEFIKEYSPNPYYWGAFVLSGDISKIRIINPSYSYNLNFWLLVLALIILSVFIWKFTIKKKA
ncbi:MAG: CHAT domain-containing protein [Ignavibacteriaceae bacterium]|nr:CHAT domain-containing protein [Ignavibacteriaceae bacterium]